MLNGSGGSQLARSHDVGVGSPTAVPVGTKRIDYIAGFCFVALSFLHILNFRSLLWSTFTCFCMVSRTASSLL